MPKLGETKFVTLGVPAGVGKFTQAPSDVALYMLLRLTGQPLESYGLQLLSFEPGDTLLGFNDATASRAAAIAKFKTWWEQNKSRAPYNQTVTPITLPAGDVAVVEFID
jgi:hypothetical protein